jgi:hypothetical protein
MISIYSKDTGMPSLKLVAALIMITSASILHQMDNAIAAESRQKQEIADKKIITSFIKVIQGGASWNKIKGTRAPEESANATNTKQSYSANDIEEYEYLKGKSSDFAEYFYRMNGQPDPYAVHKWQEPIKIGLGWQEIMLPTKAGGLESRIPFNLGLYDKKRPESYAMFKEQIITLLPSLKEKTGMEISLVDPSDPQELTENYAKIRIVPMIDPQKWRKKDPSSTYMFRSIEESLDTAIRIESSTPYAMDGFFISNADNTIGYAACKINPTLKPDTVKKLISECLISVLGLPGKYTKRAPATKAELLSILYCDQIKAGMKAKETISALKEHPNCLSPK